MKKIIKITMYVAMIILTTSYIMSNEALAQNVEKIELKNTEIYYSKCLSLPLYFSMSQK